MGLVRRAKGQGWAVLWLVLLGPAPLWSAESATSVGHGQTSGVYYTARFDAADLTFGKQMGYDTLALPEAGYLTEPGQPMLPALTVRIALPAGLAVTGARVAGSEEVALAGDYTVFPAQPPRRVSEPVTDGDFVPPDPLTYASPGPYPAEPVRFLFQTDLAGQSMAVLRVCPLRYAPATRQLTLLTELRIVLAGVEGYVCGDYLPVRISPSGRASYEELVRGLVVNPEEVVLRADAAPPGPGRGVEPGNYDYVIITRDFLMNYFQPLADWKTKKGTPAKIVDLDWIYNNGSYTGTDVEKIRAFVIDAHNTWGATYVLLGGDTNLIPCHWKTVSNESLPNDTFYADYDDDWLCEVHVGRAAARGPSAATTFVNKVLTYETDPPLTDYARTVGLFGFDLSAAGSAEGEHCKADIDRKYVPAGWTRRTVYDSAQTNHWTAARDCLNQGTHLVNHIDHSCTTCMGVGYVNHGWLLGNQDMASLHNGARQGILYSIGCWPCDYPSETCIGEAFVENPSGGGVGFVGNSRSGWYYVGWSDGASLRFDRYFFRSLFTQEHFRLGECFSDHKNDSYDGSDLMAYIYTDLTLLGDPELPVWTGDPQPLSTTHDRAVVVGHAGLFEVDVRTAAGPLPFATVWLWKDGEIYKHALTDQSGVALLWIQPASTGTLFVTATKRTFNCNYVPCPSSVRVVEPQGDLNCDGRINLGDIDPFVLALSDRGAYEAAYPNCPWLNADCNRDGAVDFADIEPFVALLGG